MKAAVDTSGKLEDLLERHSYAVAGIALFLIAFATQWRVYVRKHEAIYLLGSGRVLDPGFLAGDLSWSTLPPTTFLFDHAVAPFASFMSDFGVVTLGRFVTWALLAWSLAYLARTLKLPAWSVVAGFALFMLSRQSILACGSFLEGFQPKSFAYPLVFFAITLAIRGQVLRAGAAAGLATAFHIIIGGWGCLALFLSMLLNRGSFTNRDLVLYLLATAPFVAPLVLAVGLFHVGGLSGDEAALMDEIYVTFAQPHCTDPKFFMSSARWNRVILVLPLSLALLFSWSKGKGGKIVAAFVAMVVVFFLGGLVASSLELYSVLKVYPFQWAAGAPVMFLFVLVLAYTSSGLPKRAMGKLAWGLALVVCCWLAVDKGALTSQLGAVPGKLLAKPQEGERSRYGSSVSASRREVYAWIRENTGPESVFVTPYLPEFWIYAERAQVAGFRHPPHDRRLIEWKRRLVELNGSRAFSKRGFAVTDELDEHQPRLSVPELRRLRERYGATHLVIRGTRPELAPYVLFSSGRYSVYDLGRL